MKLLDFTSDILSISNYSDGIIIIDKEGIIEYFVDNSGYRSNIREEDVLGKSIFDVYTNITPETSTLMQVIRTGKEIRNGTQELTMLNGETFDLVFNTFPIYEDDEIVGAIELVIYNSNPVKLHVDSSEGIKENRAEALFLTELSTGLYEKIIKVADTDSPVMIYGETGTGKEHIARLMHRRRGRFIAQNCAAIPSNLLESTLFGTVKGGFTDAENKKGLFEAANGGTLFLDELNSMDLAVQAKLLKVVEEQKLMRIGGNSEIPVDVRIIATVNKSPVECVKEGSLREDLFYRLRVVQIDIPPLRKRRKDIRKIAEYYIKHFNEEMDMNILGFEPEAMKLLQKYNWPGNIRELKNVIECAFNFAEGDRIGPDDLTGIGAFTGKLTAETGGYGDLISKSERYEQYILKEALKKHGNIQNAAAKLDITRQTLSKKLKSEG